MRIPSALVCGLLLIAAAPPTTNPQVDFDGFAALTNEVRDYRAARLLKFDAFRKLAKRKDALLLDARSADAFVRGHIKGAVNLPFTDFTAASLATVIGDPDRPILIYCNNNFVNDQAPVPMKALRLALNIQTFVNLIGYGYHNVYELGDRIDFRDPRVNWVSETSAKTG